jgi:hypothetical protein
MRSVTLPLPVFGFVIATRAALGAGVGLLLAGRLSAQQRRAVGLALVGLGVGTTIPAALQISRGISRRRERSSAVESDSRLIGVTRYPRKGDDL